MLRLVGSLPIMQRSCSYCRICMLLHQHVVSGAAASATERIIALEANHERGMENGLTQLRWVTKSLDPG